MTIHAYNSHSPPNAIIACNRSVRWRLLGSLLLAVALLTNAGCRNCGQQPCAPQPYTPYAAPQYNVAPQFNTAPQYNAAPGYNAPAYTPQGFNNAPTGGSGFRSTSQTRIPSPATYSLNIPGNNNATANANNANANGYRVGQLPSGLLNTGQAAPTPAGQSGNYNQQQGWRRSDGADLNTSSTGEQSAGSRFASAATSVLESSSRVDSGASTASPTFRTASSSNAVNSGVSFTQSDDYRTTETDERLDHSRLPVTDATNVRATAPLVQNQGSGQYVAPYYEPRQQNQLASANQSIRSSQGNFSQPNYSPYQQTQTYQGNFSQPQSQVLAQSTARYDPYEATASAASGDWRTRGRDSSAY